MIYRKTRLSLNELLAVIEKGDYILCPEGCDGTCGKPPYTICVLLHDIGTDFLQSGDEEAEVVLVKFVKHDNAHIRFMAYCFLSLAESVDNVGPETRRIVKDFENDPVNAALINEVIGYFANTISATETRH
jgi:hypothetical protein